MTTTTLSFAHLIINLLEEIDFAVSEEVPRSDVIVDDDVEVTLGHVFVHVAREVEEKSKLGQDFDGVADGVRSIFAFQRLAKQRLGLEGEVQ